ncbi:MAG: tRNA (adenosine(37)-N6)-threonylcarbamoyltransferase complex dimerization subunit type 1 TsaB [Betaproteobacteria bacterium]|nr:tRNA (adenosine(37)-N6)-threonylcarbamoyltransferase complex dimerization subunit type 1 TsaB [Betaproteobacteria bacterium]
MLLLALDTSTETCSVALWREGTISARAFPAAQAHGDIILPMVRDLLDQAGQQLGDCTGIAVACGPGSFTGLRIACGVAQGLGFGADLPVAAVGTLEALAEASGGERVLACLDARMHEVYWAAYERQGTAWRIVREPTVSAPADVFVPNGGAWLPVGSGFSAYPELAPRLGLARSEQTEATPALAGAVAQLAARDWVALAGPAQRAQAMYLRNKVALTTAERAREGWR